MLRPLLRTALALSTFTVAAITLTACSLFKPEPVDIKLYVFECGNITVKNVALFSPGINEGKSKQLTNSCYLIQHPQGNLLWDTGLPDKIGPEGIEIWDGAFHLRVTQPLTAQLDSIQIKPEDIRFLGISHFHSDHTGNANLFSNASLLIQSEEFDAAFGPEPQTYGFAPESYSQLDRNKIEVLNGDHDVFGDGSVIIKKAVGHTPGHQMLLVKLPNTGPVMLSGDLYHFTSNRQHRRVPSFNFNKEQTLQAMDAIEKFVAEQKAQFWIQHDLEQNKDIRHAPAFYN